VIKAVIFDCFGVIISNDDGSKDAAILRWIKQLKGSYKIAVLSNVGPGGLARYFSKDELSVYFDVAIASGDVGYMKPSPEIYLHASSQLGVTPDECVFIDDILGHCNGAKEAGMKAVRYMDIQQAKAELERILHDSEA
jgi:putative hydrolase of the HAD superfamily